MKDNGKFSKGKKRKANLTELAKLRLPKDYPWKVLSALCMDLAVFTGEDDALLLKQIIRDRDFDSLKILSEMWGLQSFSMRSADDIEHISVIRAKYQIAALLKKFCFDTDKDMREATATQKFRDAEAACSAYNQSGYKALCWGETENDARVFTYAHAFLSKLLGNRAVSKDIVTRWSRHGPGSNLDTCLGQSSMFYKHGNWPYSCTQKAIPYARFSIATDKRWLGYLEDSYRTRFNIPKHRILDIEVFWSKVLKVVAGNRITFVPKNAQTERSIAIEPAMNLMLQLGVDGFIRKRLKRWDIDLDSQEKNQVLAYRGSTDHGDDSYITLDLAAASDSISLKLCEMLLPPAWYSYLCNLRSPKGRLKQEVFEYNKISSMGNGFTFALESAIFASLCYGAIKVSRGKCNFRTDLCIFGDDIIVKKRDASRVIRALNNAGFQLNTEKSFMDGPVRESCGADWILGKPVRPVFLDYTPTDVMELLVDLNRLKRILRLRWGIEKSKTESLLKKWIPERFRGIIGPASNEEFDSYVHSTVPRGKYTSCMYKHPRLFRKPVRINAKDFLQRKLMHDLRGSSVGGPTSNFMMQPNRPSWMKKVEYGGSRKKINASGSRFTVYKSYSYTVCKTYSSSSNWASNYAEVGPVS
jgi:hypothetical protein